MPNGFANALTATATDDAIAPALGAPPVPLRSPSLHLSNQSLFAYRPSLPFSVIIGCSLFSGQRNSG